MIICLLLFSPLHQVTILSTIALAGGLYFFFLGFRLLARKRLLLATPTSKIRSAAIGLVEVNGLAVGPYTLPAPITGKPCFLYHTTAWQQNERKDRNWEKVAEEMLHVPFFIDDATGKLLIEPLGADLDLRRDFKEEYSASLLSGDLDQIPPRVSSFLLRHGLTATPHLRIEEHTIKPDDPLFAAGTLTENPGIQVRAIDPGKSSQQNAQSPEPQTSAPEVIRLSSGPAPLSTREMSQQAKIAAALTRAGITRPEAWSAAGVPYPFASTSEENTSISNFRENSPAAEQQSDPRFDLTPPVVMMKGSNDPTFVISFRSQKEFVSALAWKSAAMIGGGSAIILLAVYMLLLQIQWL